MRIFISQNFYPPSYEPNRHVYKVDTKLRGKKFRKLSSLCEISYCEISYPTYYVPNRHVPKMDTKLRGKKFRKLMQNFVNIRIFSRYSAILLRNVAKFRIHSLLCLLGGFSSITSRVCRDFMMPSCMFMKPNCTPVTNISLCQEIKFSFFLIVQLNS
jgi:hypothetical protein